jgi:hypothetical protein
MLIRDRQNGIIGSHAGVTPASELRKPGPPGGEAAQDIVINFNHSPIYCYGFLNA